MNTQRKPSVCWCIRTCNEFVYVYAVHIMEIRTKSEKTEFVEANANITTTSITGNLLMFGINEKTSTGRIWRILTPTPPKKNDDDSIWRFFLAPKHYTVHMHASE